MTRFLMVGDSHGDYNFMRNMIDVAETHYVDTIIQLGDFGFVWRNDEVENNAIKLANLNNYAAVKGKDIWFLPGNHEDWDALDKLSSKALYFPECQVATNILYLGKINKFTIDGLKFAVAGGAFSIDRGWRTLNESWWLQEELTDDEVEQVKTFDAPVDVLLTHDAPTWQQLNIMPIPESYIHRQRMDQVHKHLKPKLWMHGHYHQFVDNLDRDTRVVGLACNGHWDVNHAILDTETLELEFL